MQPTSSSYKLIKRVKDDRLDEENLHLYDLIIQTGPKDFQVAVINTAENRLLLLEDYAMGNVQSHQELLVALKELFESHAMLGAGFWKEVKIGIKNNKFCQVPDAFFEESKSSDYLKLNASFNSQEKVLFCQNKGIGAVTVFAVQQDLYDWLSELYQNTSVHFYHQSTVLIEGVLQQTKNTSHTLYIYIDRFKLHILSASSGKLNYYNQFPIKQFSDYVKCIMLVLKGLNMDQQSSEIVLWGYIGKNSPHYAEFIKYIPNVVFGERPKHLKFNYLFDEIQEHHFFDLYSLSLLNNS
ncbi:MAG: hypothetical protein OJF59_002934 [Cytophagales bacterium]|nr:DUF3822 family protein [Bacteroidota bacterium]MBS1979621.1 DUF3822 family protein [Bacteroidota bacterium]WHZ09178.1 MAG: hypothetical protein OJF59_002934 [Cytophagales bacterium]